MLISRKLIQYTFLFMSVIIVLSCFHATKKAEAIFNEEISTEEISTETISYEKISSINVEIPIYKIPISEDTQREIWKLCEENNLSYELVLAIYQTEGIDNIQIDNMKADIEKLVYIREYWTQQGFPDETVFDLMLLSKQRGIEGCTIFMQDSDAYNLVSYVQKVTEYKYYLEQSLDVTQEIKKQ